MYIYQADTYCDECGQKIAAECKKPDYPKPWDTDDYPAYYPEGEETDCPSACGACGKPLDYTLTGHGVAYVLQEIRESIEEAVEQGRAGTWDRIMPAKGTGEEEMTWWHGSRHIEITRDWAKHLQGYCLEADEKALVGLFLDLSAPK